MSPNLIPPVLSAGLQLIRRDAARHSPEEYGVWYGESRLVTLRNGVELPTQSARLEHISMATDVRCCELHTESLWQVKLSVYLSCGAVTARSKNVATPPCRGTSTVPTRSVPIAVIELTKLSTLVSPTTVTRRTSGCTCRRPLVSGVVSAGPVSTVPTGCCNIERWCESPRPTDIQDVSMAAVVESASTRSCADREDRSKRRSGKYATPSMTFTATVPEPPIVNGLSSTLYPV